LRQVVAGEPRKPKKQQLMAAEMAGDEGTKTKLIKDIHDRRKACRITIKRRFTTHGSTAPMRKCKTFFQNWNKKSRNLAIKGR